MEHTHHAAPLLSEQKHQQHTHHDHSPVKKEGQTFNKHAGHHTHDFLKRFWICLAITLPVLVLSPMLQHWVGLHFQFTGSNYLLVLFSSFIYFYGGWPFITGMFREIRFRNIGMMTLVAIAITVAYIYSVAILFGLEGMDFFWELATLIDIMLLGHWLEMRSEMAASMALESLVALLPSKVHVERNGTMVDIPLAELKKEDVMHVKPGEKIAADGFVVGGNSSVNESMLTGESKPVSKTYGDKVIGGSINNDGALTVHVAATGQDSYLSKVIMLVTNAQQTKSRTQNLADKVAKWLTIISIVAGTATFFYWFSGLGNISFALERMVTVMVTSCPHALGVAIPLVVALSTTYAATHGLLIRNRTAFESARKLTTVIFDKTGTLTKGSHEVQKIISLDKRYDEKNLLQYAAAVEQNSEHYIASGIMRRFRETASLVWPVMNFASMKGKGVQAEVEGKQVVVAGPNYFTGREMQVPSLPAGIDPAAETVVFILIDGEIAGAISLADEIREGSREAIDQLDRLGIRSFLLTGDNEMIAKKVAGELGMKGYMANVLPEQKQDKVKELQSSGEFVAMTGDGVNDAPALAQADVGIAIGSGTDVAAETADIILVNSDPGDIAKLISFGKATYRKMVENLAWAVGYNILAIPLAAGVLYPYFTLSPAMGAILMSVSTIVVAINARTLRFR